MTAAERKKSKQPKLWPIRQRKKNVTTKKKNKRLSQLRKLQITKRSKEERLHFRVQEVAPVTTSIKWKKQTKPDPPLQVNIPAKNPYKSRQSFGKALNRCQAELPYSPRKKSCCSTGLAKEVGLSIQNDYEKQCHGSISASLINLKKLLKILFQI